MRSIILEDLDQDRQFQIRLQISLLASAIDISKLYSDPARFEPYIRKRISRIIELVGQEGDFVVKYHGKVVYPLEGTSNA